MRSSVVITGMGMVTPLGKTAEEVMRRLEAGESAAAPPTHFNAQRFACPVCAEVQKFQPEEFVSESKIVRLMNRDSQLAVAAAHLALEDASIEVGATYAPEEIALFGATGTVGLPIGEVIPLLRASTRPDGGFDLTRFGTAGLRSVRPILSFKILSNMPICFVSICENIQGVNSVFTPWEGQGAQAVAAAVRALDCGEARCALVGGCDVKTHELAFLGLEQQGVFQSWKETGRGLVPGEGAVFLVMEDELQAVARRANIYARVGKVALGTRHFDESRTVAYSRVLSRIRQKVCKRAVGRGGDHRLFPSQHQAFGSILSAENGDDFMAREEGLALASLGIAADEVIRPKAQTGDLFAGAAPLQCALGAFLVRRGAKRVLANCFGHGSEQASFVLEDL